MSYLISKNDGALAHGTARWLSDAQPMREFLDACQKLKHLDGLTAKAVKRLVPDSLSKYIIDESIIKPSGQRAKALWRILAPLESAFVLLEFGIVHSRFIFADTGITVSHHAFARLIQRSTGSSQLQKNIGYLRLHLLLLLTQLHSRQLTYGRVKDEAVIYTYTIAGKMIWQAIPEDKTFLGKTWVDRGQFGELDLARAKELLLQNSPTGAQIFWEEGGDG